MKRILIVLFPMFCALLPMHSKAQTGDLYLYGGVGHNVFLGCVSCSTYDSQSIWNSVGIYGSNNGAHSIWNQYGSYGSDYSNESAFNENATEPPVVKDAAGNIYGYLTLDRFKQGRMENDVFIWMYDHYKDIREDPTAWYNKKYQREIVLE